MNTSSTFSKYQHVSRQIYDMPMTRSVQVIKKKIVKHARYIVGVGEEAVVGTVANCSADWMACA